MTLKNLLRYSIKKANSLNSYNDLYKLDDYIMMLNCEEKTDEVKNALTICQKARHEFLFPSTKEDTHELMQHYLYS